MTEEHKMTDTMGGIAGSYSTARHGVTTGGLRLLSLAEMNRRAVTMMQQERKAILANDWRKQFGR
jgi:hypothetical protein